ncbi:UNC93-like protein MFSD11 [Prorops nasuta]|uniref:UNC93-like protein MFSD11 n=1 Tax=Prorops nasuta TaxID=863751 RepID=UPI0034CF4AA8
MTIDRNFLNVLILSFGFMLVFTAFQTIGNIEKTVLKSINDDDPSFTGDGYISLAIIYAVFATCNWLAPSYISVTGPRIAILTGCVCYALFIGSFLWPKTELLYVVSGINGVGAALIWTGQGQYLTENSDSDTMSRNAGVFWAIFQSSMFIGNLFVYFMFAGSEKIAASTRNTVFLVLTSLAVTGTVLLATLQKSPTRLSLGEAEGVSSADKELQIPEPERKKPLVAAWHAMRDAMSLFITSKMILLAITFIYTGLFLTFFSGVYSNCIGFTSGMGENRKSLIPLSGILIGTGEVVGGALFGILASKLSYGFGGWPVVVTGFGVHLFAFISIYLNLPNDAPFQDTSAIGFIHPSPILAMIGSIALGFGDACFNTQVYSLLGTLFSKESTSAFALFKFCQSVAAAISFSYSTRLGLHYQLLILLISMSLGTATFCYVEYNTRKSRADDQPDTDPALVETSSVED